MQRVFLSLAGIVTLGFLVAPPVRSEISNLYKTRRETRSEEETFFGTILKDGQTFVLSDPATKSRYTLDAPQKASRYEGLTVKVTGTIDNSTNLIHVDTIEKVP
jgi:hypothetical protein